MFFSVKYRYFIFILIGAMLMFSLFGCFGKSPKIIYNGTENLFSVKPDRIRAGDDVTLTVPVADDSFVLTVNGQNITPSAGENSTAFEFTMPDQDADIQFTGKVMVFDYYKKITGTPEDQGYDEIILSYYSSGEAVIDVYSRSGPDGDENHSEYRIPFEGFDGLYDIIDRYKMDGWETMKNTVSLNGMLYVGKYLRNGRYIRTASDCMPEDGEKAYAEIMDYIQSIRNN